MMKRMALATFASLTLAATAGTPRPAVADTASTASIVAAAAAITGALIYDSSNHPYYVRNNRRYYVNGNVAQYYRAHHRGYERRAYVAEPQYPVARAYGHDDGGRDGRHGGRGNDHR